MIALLAAALAVQAAEDPAKRRLPYSIEFARGQIGAWQVEAKSLVEDATGMPMRGTVSCDMRRSGVMLTTWREGQLSVYLGGYNLSGDQLELGVSPNEVRRVEIDGSAWDYRWLGRWREDSQFSDLDYPPAPHKYPPGWDIIHYPVMEALSGWIAVRRGPGRPWFGADVLANELVRARRLRIGFVDQDRDPKPDEGPLYWAELPLDDLRDAFDWCSQAMHGERARLFEADLDP